MKYTEKIEMVATDMLVPFQKHPFKSRFGDENTQLAASIIRQGTLNPLLVRPLADGKYEVISGHRRLEACKEIGEKTVPVIVREMSDDEAIITMVDSNLHREHILPSEKAFAYKMKVEALNHQGVSSVQLGQKSSRSIVADDVGISETQIQRYIRLTYLIPELLSKVDDGKMAFNPAVEISYLTHSEQRTLLDAMELNDCTPSHAQSIRMKKLSQDGALIDQTIYDIVSEEKPNQQEQFKFKREDIRKYFPKSYTDKQVCDEVFKALELLKHRRERGAR